MADKVMLEETADWGFGADVTYSDREYDAYETQAARLEDEGSRYYGIKEAVTLTLYVDDLTGVVVRDIAKYEASLK